MLIRHANGGEQKRANQQMTTPVRRYAVFAAGLYFAVTCLWIQMSSDVIVKMAGGNAERLDELLRFKGYGFMAATAVAFYFSIMMVMKKTARTADALHETQERWMEAERQAAPALVASCIAHDVANLLTVLRLNLEKMKRIELGAGPARDVLNRLDNSTDRLIDLVKRLRGASSSLFQEAPVSFDFSKSVDETLALMQTHVSCEAATVELVPMPGVALNGYPVLVHQLVMNLLINAAEATGRTGHVRFVVGKMENGVTLTVDDNGPGIEPSLREKVLSAFFTTKKTGSGLGLTSVRSCVEIHKGLMQISESPDLGGARFSITLPDLTIDRVADLRRPDRSSDQLTPSASQITYN